MKKGKRRGNGVGERRGNGREVIREELEGRFDPITLDACMNNKHNS